MKRTRRILALILALVLAFSLTAMVAAEETETAYNGSIVILHTNDVHGGVTGYAKLAALKDYYEAQGSYVLLVDAGDFSQGDPTVNVSQGATAVELMNMAGYDLATIGNHEFDYGFANLQSLVKAATFSVVSANVLYGGKAAFEENKIFTAPDGTKIGFFGLSTPESATKAHPAKIQGVTFLAADALYACAQQQVDTLKEAGCDYIICLSHLGIDDESVGNRSIDMLAKVTGIDVLIDGHSHSTLDDIKAATDGTGKVGDTLVTSAGTKLETVGIVTLNKEQQVVSAASQALSAVTVTEVKEIADRVAAIQKEIDDDYGAVFAKTEVDLNGERDPGNRTEETNLGDLICDALVWGAAEAGTKVDAALTNGGGIRASIAKGDITKKDVNTVLPFGNTLSIVEVTGAELLEVLEASTYCTPEAIGGFPQASGIVFTVDTDAAYDAGELYPGTTYYAPASINRVTIESVGGKAFDSNATYTIATNDFMAAGGDTYYAFTEASVNYDLGEAMDAVLMDYITEELNGVVTAEKYGEPRGDITIAGALPFTDVVKSDWYYDGVKYAYTNSLFKGTSGTTFAPKNSMTRGEMVTVLYRMAGSPETEADLPFTDVADHMYYADAIAWAFANKVVNGTSGTTFSPDQTITRQEFATILYRYSEMKEYDVTVEEDASLDQFTDAAAVSAYAQEALTWANAEGLITGITKTTIAPAGTATRGQVAVILMRFVEGVASAA